MRDLRDDRDAAPGARDEAALLDELQQLLERQLELTRGGNTAGLDEVGERANAVVGRMAKAHMMDSPAFRSRRSLLDKLFKELYLTLATQRQETCDALIAVRQGKRLLRIYEEHASRK